MIVSQTSLVFSRWWAAAQKIWARVFRAKKRADMSVWTRELSLLAGLAAALTYLLLIIDPLIISWARQSESVIMHFLKVVTDAAKSHYYLIPALFIMALISGFDWKGQSIKRVGRWVRSYERAAFIFFSIIIPGITINILKQYIGRGRPRTFDEFGAHVTEPFVFSHVFQSFPSGHSGTAGSLGMLIALFWPPLRIPALILFGVLAFARVAANAHYASDVLAGYTIGALMTLVFARWLASRNIMFEPDKSSIFPKIRP